MTNSQTTLSAKLGKPLRALFGAAAENDSDRNRVRSGFLCIPNPRKYICIYAAAYSICCCVHSLVLNLPIIPKSFLMHVGPSILGCICHQLIVCQTVLHCHQPSSQSSHVPASRPPSSHSRAANSSSSPAQNGEGLQPQGTSCSHNRADDLATSAQHAKQIHADGHARKHTGVPCATMVTQPCRVSHQLS